MAAINGLPIIKVLSHVSILKPRSRLRYVGGEGGADETFLTNQGVGEMQLGIIGHF